MAEPILIFQQVYGPDADLITALLNPPVDPVDNKDQEAEQGEPRTSD